MSWKIYTTNDGNIAIVTPYNPAIVAEAKRRMGRYIDLTLGAGRTVKAWKLDASHREAMEQLCRELFDTTTMVERVISWSTDFGSAYSPTLDGYDLIRFGRDGRSVRRFDAGEPIKVLEIIENTTSTGGSRNNPRLFGSIRLRVRCRAAAEAGGQGWTVTVEF